MPANRVIAVGLVVVVVAVGCNKPTPGPATPSAVRP